jgi:putative ABC transport system ATP-binding protein
MSIILEAKKLQKKFNPGKKNEIHILKEIDLKIEQGEFVCLMGPSGSGKSTLLYNISGMDKATSGEVLFDQNMLTQLPEKKLSEIRLNEMGFVFQHIHLLKNLSIFDNIILTGYQAKKTDKKSIDKRAEKLMEMCGISQLKDKNVSEVSGGEMQRVAICRALINGPKIVFGDEPTGALNSKSTGEILQLLQKVNKQGASLLLATHDVRVAAQSQRVIFLLDGKIVAENKLGKLKQATNLKEREEKLSSWLIEKGF